MTGWRVRAVEDDTTFLRDEIKLFMAYKDDDGFRAVSPILLELTECLPADTVVPPTTIPRELAEQIYNQLGHMLTGVSEPFDEIQRLRRELNESRKMLSNLINGIGRLGGKNAE